MSTIEDSHLSCFVLARAEAGARTPAAAAD
jgi:hypothetical protein